MIPLYMDECVHGAITRGLRQRGIDVLTAQEDGRDNTPDRQVLDRAGELKRLLFTNDPDFIDEVNRRQARGQAFIGVIYSHQRTSIGRCIEDLELIAKCSALEEYTNRLQRLPL